MQNQQASSLSSDRVPKKPVYDAVKRLFDLVAGSLGLLVLSPLLVAISVAVRVDTPGPIFFRQKRLGRDAVPFTMTKFRTMAVDNDDSAHREFMVRHVQGQSSTRENEEGAEVFLLEDERITRVGKVLRRTSLDELPNLVNVIGGSMSIVGPRPPIPYEVEHYDSRAMTRMQVKPGMTGYAQIRGRGSLTFDEMVSYDLEYIEDRSLWTDLKIVAATIPAVLFKRGV